MSDQAKACMSVWEGMLYGDAKLGSLAHGRHSNGESGTTRRIRTVWKSVQERGCEKSGRMIYFATAMKENYGLDRIPLYSFLGNHFNILILNGAGVYFMYQTLLTFFNNIEIENKLLAVVWDLEVLAYYVACTALGLIGKLLTGPLWR